MFRQFLYGLKRMIGRGGARERVPPSSPPACLPEQMPALALAYVGDAVYELYVRTTVINRGNYRVRELHTGTVALVRAAAQAERVQRIMPLLTEEEAAVVRRGRNARLTHSPRSADLVAYRYSTGLEALLGYLFLRGETERLMAFLALLVDDPGGGRSNNGSHA